jgi:hypothetical protein
MAQEEKEDVIEEVTEPQTDAIVEETQQQEETQEQPEFKNEVLEDGTIKVDLRSFNTNSEQQSEEQVEEAEEETTQQVVEEVAEEATEEVTEEQPIIEEVTDEEVLDKLEEDIEEAISIAEEKGTELPESIQKVIDFMDDTGGSLEDYVQLNKDYSNMSDNELVEQYLKATKPHLTDEEISFVMEDLYSYDEDLDDERDIRRKKLALKEQVNNAKNHLEGQKSKYYEEVKAGSKLTPEQQKAVNFFNRYNKETEETAKVAEQQKSVFNKKTEEVFSDKFKGFEYNIGDKKFRFNVNNASEVKSKQSDINNFIKKFLDENNNIKDAKGYHKSLFTAMNADAIANHFYEQGKADGIKGSIDRSKNIDMDPRQSYQPSTQTGGIKARVVSGDSSSQFKVKIKQ